MTGAFRFGFDNCFQLSIPFYGDEYSRRVMNAIFDKTKGTSRFRRVSVVSRVSTALLIKETART
jgi:hypothetical protein